MKQLKLKDSISNKKLKTLTRLIEITKSEQILKSKLTTKQFGRRQYLQTCKWLLTSSFVRPSTFITSLICFGVAPIEQKQKTH